jgi:hypothetical protein
MDEKVENLLWRIYIIEEFVNSNLKQFVDMWIPLW